MTADIQPEAQPTKTLEIGIHSLGELVSNPHTGQTISAQQRLQEMLAQAKLADELGLDVMGIGEHHRLDCAVASPAVVIAAIAQVTQRIRLTSAVTILGALDPVRIFQDYATADLLSNGRVEIIAGRGMFLEAFSLFGYDTDDHQDLFMEKILLLKKLNSNERVTWQGRYRSALNNAEIAPRPLQKQLPLWIGVEGASERAERAGMVGLPMMLTVIAGLPSRVAHVELYRQAGAKASCDAATLKVGITSHLHVQKESQKAREDFYPHYMHYFNRTKPGQSFSHADYEQLASLEGALFVGSPQQIIDKILYQYELFGHQRFLAQLDIGALPYANVAESIELLVTEVAPVVRRATAQ